MAVPSVSRVITAQGPRALQERCLADLSQAIQARGASISPPILVVTATGGQQMQLAERLVHRAGGAVLGVECVTLWSLVRRLCETIGKNEPVGDALIPILVERHARLEPELAAALDRFESGYGVLVSSVRDLLSAGFRAAARFAVNARTKAVLRVTEQVERELEQLGVTRFGAQLRQAAAALQAEPALLPQSQLAIYGFNDANGDALALLRALLQLGRTRCYVDRPNDPCARFVDRFIARLGATEIEHLPQAVPIESISQLEAPGTDAELRAVAAEIRALLDRGVPAESIAIVARGADEIALTWRQIAHEQAIPFSGEQAPDWASPSRRRDGCCLRLLKRRHQVEIEDWLEIEPSIPQERRDDVRLALRVLQVQTLADAAALDLNARLGDAAEFSLPVRIGRVAGDEDQISIPRRKLARTLLSHLVTRARRASEELAGWSGRLTCDAHAQKLRAIEACHEWLDRLELSSWQFPGDLRLDPDEWIQLAEARGRALAQAPLGGRGGGVQFLDSARARGLVFEQLFLTGLNQGRFPAERRIDPVLDERARRALATTLPDLNTDLWNEDEERALFLGLVNAAAHVCVSWLRSDESGKPKAPSSFIQVLPQLASTSAPRIIAREASQRLAQLTDRSPREALLASALANDRDDWQRRLAVMSGDPHWAQARRQILDELEPTRQRAELGPYFGALLPHTLYSAPRTVSITSLERVAHCGWQAFLTRWLRLETSPDPAREWPSITRLLRGNATHRALEMLFRPVENAPMSRPDEATLHRVVTAAARREAHSAGLIWDGLIRVLTQQVESLVRRAIEVDFAAGDRFDVEAVEHELTMAVPREAASAAQVTCRADRVDRIATTGHRRLTDFKTGRPFATGKRAETRQAQLRAGIASGQILQAAAYAASASDAEGRYLYLAEELEDVVRSVTVPHDSAEQLLFRTAVTTLVDALEAGPMFPRLFDSNGKTNPLCTWCEVASACLQGDTGARRRFRAAIEAWGESDSHPAARLWRLAQRESSP